MVVLIAMAAAAATGILFCKFTKRRQLRLQFQINNQSHRRRVADDYGVH